MKEKFRFSNYSMLPYYLCAAVPLVVGIFSLLVFILDKRIQLMKANEVEPGINQLTLNLSDKNISAGIYLLNFKSEKFNKTIRLIYTGE